MSRKAAPALWLFEDDDDVDNDEGIDDVAEAGVCGGEDGGS